MTPFLQLLTLLTGILCTISLSAGIYGFIWGSRLGEEALAGVSQPTSGHLNPTVAGVPTPKSSTEGLAPGFLSETEILDRVKAKTNNPGTPKTKVDPPPASASTGRAANNFPISTQAQGVTLELQSSQVKEDNLVFQVLIRNDGNQPVRFLYSFLKVTDNRGRSLSANAQGLPGELPALSGNFQGELRIPTALLEGVTSLKLSLADYPDQNVTLALDDIPVSLPE